MFRSKICTHSTLLSILTLAGVGFENCHAYEFNYKAFGSAYYGQALTKDLLPNGFNNTNPDFQHFSLIGSNLSVKLNDRFSAAAQIVASGKNVPTGNFQFYSEWAYVAYSAFEGNSIKFGRQRYPVWTASEFFNIGYELPMRAIPALVFGISPFVAFDGGSITQSFDLGSTNKLSVELFGGQPLIATYIPPGTVTIMDTNLLGARATLELDGLRLRAQASRTHVSINIPSPTSSTTYASNQTIYTLGYRFDKYNIVSWAEYAFTHSPDGPNVPASPGIAPGVLASYPAGVSAVPGGKYLGTGRAGYIMLGYKLNDWLPRYTFSEINTQYGLFGGKTNSHVFGLNYYAGKGTVVKAEFELNSVPTPNGGYSVTQPIASAKGTSGNAFYLGVDFVFGS